MRDAIFSRQEKTDRPSVVGLGLGGSEAYPGVFAPVGGYAEECVVGGGGVAPGASPGFGLEAKADLAPHIEALLA